MEPRQQRFMLWYVALAVLAVLVARSTFLGPHRENLLYSEFKTLVRQAKVSDLVVQGETISGTIDVTGLDSILSRERIDMLTGTNQDGTLAAGQTCADWTSNGEGSAMLGHHDRMGPDTLATATSWNAAHPSRGCSQEALIGTGGNGYFMCFAAQ